MRVLIALLADENSVIELRRAFAPGMITALIRIEGRPLGLIANNPMHLGGAIDAAGADKAARFFQLCNAHRLPILSLCDTPGFMVGPDAEHQAQVRHVCRMFVGAAALAVPLFCIVPRRGYGLGAMAMAAGGFHESFFTAAWPSGEFGGMGLEGAVRLGYKRELEAERIPPPAKLVRNPGRAALCRGQSHQYGLLSRNRRRHRSHGHPRLDLPRPGRRAAGATAAARLHRRLVGFRRQVLVFCPNLDYIPI